MASRREFLQAGLAASLIPVVGSASEASNPPLPYYKVIVDERFPASVAFGVEWKARGAAVHAMRGDITDLWFHDLDHRWKQHGPAAIAGLTAHGPLFCLERLAWDHGMRVVSRVDQGAHDQDGEPLISWVIAPKKRAQGN
jgi:hypothetical protein